mmetsp:Transcript_83866/g.161865  ORF Transcript_83866/g.161865 Transcript_83866/m.161865 type:complete len:113 (+) Transcript_83866:314-652(+)
MGPSAAIGRRGSPLHLPARACRPASAAATASGQQRQTTSGTLQNNAKKFPKLLMPLLHLLSSRSFQRNPDRGPVMLHPHSHGAGPRFYGRDLPWPSLNEDGVSHLWASRLGP